MITNELTGVLMRTACRTSGCPIAEAGEVFDVLMYPAAVPPIWRAVCAGCDKPITDITPL
ncbi:hypothetical protein ACIQU7_23510 [Streptomyces albidoflavus]